MADQEFQGRDPLREAGVSRLVVFAPNWLGDAVMALPALADVRRASTAATIAVAARSSVAPLFRLVPGVAEVIPLDRHGPAWRDAGGPLRAGRFDAAILLPNSFHAAFTARRAGIRERWGYATDWRRWLLTRSAVRPATVHQAAYYQHLTRSLGFPPGPLMPCLDLSRQQRDAGAEFLRGAGWDGRASVVAIAAGAAYGGAKKWPARSFAAVATALARDGIVPVTIGTTADAQASRDVLTAAGPGTRMIDLTGRTDLPMLAAVLSVAQGLVTNDSGAMHLAAALGVPVTAIFGPTDETATHPIGRAPHAVLTHHVWCRPCMLRECPLNHACMRGVQADDVARTASAFATGARPAVGDLRSGISERTPDGQ